MQGIRGGGHSGIDGGGTHVTYFAESGLFLRPLHVRDFVKKRVIFCTQVRSMGGENPLFNNPRSICGSDDK